MLPLTIWITWKPPRLSGMVTSVDDEPFTTVAVPSGIALKDQQTPVQLTRFPTTVDQTIW